jgi:alpha-mannosidase
MHDDRVLLEARLDRFVHERLEPALHSPGVPVSVERWDVPGEPVSFYRAAAQDFRPAASGEARGAPGTTTWLRLSGEVPPGFNGRGREPELLIDLGFSAERVGFQAEGLAWKPDATLVALRFARAEVTA